MTRAACAVGNRLRLLYVYSVTQVETLWPAIVASQPAMYCENNHSVSQENQNSIVLAVSSANATCLALTGWAPRMGLVWPYRLASGCYLLARIFTGHTDLCDGPKVLLCTQPAPGNQWWPEDGRLDWIGKFFHPSVFKVARENHNEILDDWLGSPPPLHPHPPLTPPI